jgi:hypothetical protein
MSTTRLEFVVERPDPMRAGEWFSIAAFIALDYVAEFLVARLADSPAQLPSSAIRVRKDGAVIWEQAVGAAAPADPRRSQFDRERAILAILGAGCEKAVRA